MDDNKYEASRQEVIRYLNSVIEKEVAEEDEPRALGGPYTLTAKDMLCEVEKDSDIARQFVSSFAQVKREILSRPIK